MDIAFNCDKCGQHIVIDEAGAGMIVPCPTCGASLIVPATYSVCARGDLGNIGPNEIVTPQGITTKLLVNSKNWIPDCPQTIYEQIQRSLLEGWNKGETERQLIKRVQKQFDVNEERAYTIAHAEGLCANNKTQFHLFKSDGYMSKKWVTSNDELVRPSHRQCKKQGAIPINQPFSNGLMYPGDLSAGKLDECFGCRCYLIVPTGRRR
jgi:SPP1 gp7 family putative phage head morphogenesis protein